MRSSTSFSDIAISCCLGGLLCLAFGTPAGAAVMGTTDATPPPSRIAILPVINLSGAAAPLKEIHKTLRDEAAMQGVTVLAESELEQFMMRHRLRYTGGVDQAIARAFRSETGVDGVLVTALEQYDPAYPAKIAIDSRLVSTDEVPGIVWADAVAMAGDEAPGLFGTGLVDTPARLSAMAISRLASSLAAGVTGRGMAAAEDKASGRFRPKIAFRSPDLAAGKTVRVAVVPFLNRSLRSNAGEILALQFVRELARQGKVTVIEPGLVRQKFLAFRVIMEEGLSLANAAVLFEVLDADLIVTGDVLEYDDYQGSMGTPRVALSTWLLDRAGQKIVFAAESHNSGGDGVFFFDIGKQRNAQLLAKNMVRVIVEQMFPLALAEAYASKPAAPTSRGTISTGNTKEGEQ